MNTKILFTDLDGTLLTSDKRISEKNLNAINKLIAAGHKAVFVTGRPAVSGIAIARAYGLLNPGFFVVGYNGGIIYDAGKDEIIYSLACSFDDLRTLMDKGENAGLSCLTYTRTHVIAEKDTDAVKAYSRGLGMPCKIVPDSVGCLKSEDYLPYKVIITTLNGRDRLEAFKRLIDPEISGRLYSLVTSDVLLEIGPAAVSKGRAVETLCKKLDIPMENSYAVGDESNDLSMVAAAGHGLAVANAIEELKSIAETTLKRDNDHDAIEEVVMKILQ